MSFRAEPNTALADGPPQRPSHDADGASGGIDLDGVAVGDAAGCASNTDNACHAKLTSNHRSVAQQPSLLDNDRAAAAFCFVVNWFIVASTQMVERLGACLSRTRIGVQSSPLVHVLITTQYFYLQIE